MPRAMHMPADLDAVGQQLWTTFVALRQREDEARVAARTARVALRRQPLTAAPVDRDAMTTQYHRAVATRDEITDQRMQAEHAYRAYRRGMLIHSQQVTAHRATAARAAADVRSLSVRSIRQRRQR